MADTHDTSERLGSRGELNRSRKHAAKLMALGLCTVCRQPHDRQTRRCRPCTLKAGAANKRIKMEAQSSKQCVDCRQPWTGLTKRCTACKSSERAKWHARAGTDYCARCAQPRDSAHRSCAACRSGMRVVTNERRTEYAAAGLCVQCGAKRDVPQGVYCSTHILKLAAYRWLNDMHRWAELLTLFEKQGGRCAYTGELLTLSENASIDHKTPRSLGGTNTIDNLQWVTWTVNRSKTDMTHEAFVQMCEQVSRRQVRA